MAPIGGICVEWVQHCFYRMVDRIWIWSMIFHFYKTLSFWSAFVCWNISTVYYLFPFDILWLKKILLYFISNNKLVMHSAATSKTVRRIYVKVIINSLLFYFPANLVLLNLIQPLWSDAIASVRSLMPIIKSKHTVIIVPELIKYIIKVLQQWCINDLSVDIYST